MEYNETGIQGGPRNLKKSGMTPLARSVSDFGTPPPETSAIQGESTDKHTTSITR
jgi:hypothetical protein